MDWGCHTANDLTITVSEITHSAAICQLSLHGQLVQGMSTVQNTIQNNEFEEQFIINFDETHC